MKTPVVNYDAFGNPVSLQGTRGEAITKSDTLTFEPGVLYVGTKGDITVRMPGATSGLLFKNVEGWFPVRVDMVYSTGTDASDINVVR